MNPLDFFIRYEGPLPMSRNTGKWKNRLGGSFYYYYGGSSVLDLIVDLQVRIYSSDYGSVCRTTPEPPP